MERKQHCPYNIYIEQNPKYVEEIRTIFGEGAFRKAADNLSSSAFAIYVYLCMEQNGKLLRVYKPDLFKIFPHMNDNQYYRAMQELIAIGYMKWDEETGFYNFNPNVEITPIKKERRTVKKSMYPDIVLPKDNESFSRQQIKMPTRRNLPDNAFYIIPLNSAKRGNIKNVYFCKGKLIDLRENIEEIVYNEMNIPSVNSHRVKEYALTLILNRAIDYTSFPHNEEMQKAVCRLPMISQMREEGNTYLSNGEKIPWDNAMVKNNALVRELFEKETYNGERIPLGAVVVGEE